MDLPKYYNLVSFTGNGSAEAFLTLEADWVITAGMAPSVNVAIVPVEEFGKIGTNWTGSIKFYFSDADAPDVELSNITVVDVQPGRIGQTQDDGDTSPMQILDYRVSFADVRHQLVPPRGGILMKGDINMEPVIGPTPGDTPPDLTDTGELLVDCLQATGQQYTLGASIDAAQLPPMRMLQWFGARAPDELSRLLQWVGGVLYVTSNGWLGVDLLGQGASASSLDGDDVLLTAVLPAIDRRGKTVVFVSAPTPGQLVFDGTQSSQDAPTWSWVARDTDGSWQTLDQNSILDGLDVDEELANGWQDVPDQWVAQIDADVYRCLQLDSGTYNPLFNSLLKQVADTNGILTDITVSGSLARQNAADGSWTNTDATAQIQVTHVIGAQNVIRLAERVVTVNPSPTLDLLGNLQDVKESSLKIKFAMEAAGDDGTGKGYFACGFTRASIGGSLTVLSPQQVTSALQGGNDIVILHTPASRVIQTNGATMDQGDNFSDLLQQCQQLAETVLAGSDNTYTLTVARGFKPVELSGVVSEIRYSQSEARTTVRQNSWFAPATAYQVDQGVASKLATSRAGASGGSAGGEAHDNQAVTIAGRNAMGASGSHQPLHLVGDTPPPLMLRFDCVAQISGANSESGKGFYDVDIADLPLSPDPTQSLQSQISFSQNTTKGVMMNLGEIGSGLQSPGIQGEANEFAFFCMRGPVLTDGPAAGKTLVWTYYDCACYRSFQYIIDPAGSGNYFFQGSCTFPLKTADPSWQTLLTFNPCPSS